MSDTVIVVTRMQVKENKIDEFFQTASPFLAETRKEGGVLLYDLYQDKVDSSFCILHEEWKNLEAINVHMTTSHFGEFMGKSSGLLERMDPAIDNPFQVTIAQPFDPEHPPTSEIVLVATRMKAKTSSIDEVKTETISTIVEPSKAEDRCLGYDLFQNKDDTSLFILFEQWNGFKAIADHMKTDHFAAFMKLSARLLTPLKEGSSELFEVMICTPYSPDE
jgi:quinol monooxygenase YgiN